MDFLFVCLQMPNQTLILIFDNKCTNKKVIMASQNGATDS